MAVRLDIFRWPPAVRAALPAALVASGLVHAQERVGRERVAEERAAQERAAPERASGGTGGNSSSPYSIDCPASPSAEEGCAADLTTYIGWRVFDRYCASCHGGDAEGSTFAPSLVHRLQRYDRRAFDRALDEGYAGPLAPMRPWGEHPQVARYYAELWAYLSARRNGDVPPVPLRPFRERPADATGD